MKEETAMQTNSLRRSVLVAAMLCVVPALLPPASSASPGVPSSEETSNLLQQLERDALTVKNVANRLRALARDPFVTDWQDDGDQLIRIRSRVNDMDKLLAELRTNQSADLPWQQKAIQSIAPTVVNLTDTAEAAVVSLNQNQGEVYQSNVYGLSQDLYNQAGLITKTIRDVEKSAAQK
ncbi:MAG: hypothetical protein ABSH52_03905 [Terriglobia bacterium]|jgi:hypothetical protein